MSYQSHRQRHPARPLVVLLIVFVGNLLFNAAVTSAGSPPDFKLKDLQGDWFSLGEHLGQEVVYVSFWATWCVPCRRELPHLQEMYNDLAEQGFLVVSVNTDPASTQSKIKPYVRRYKLSFPVVLDPDNNVLDKYNPTRELPYAVLVDRRGNVHKTFPGYRAGDEKVLRQDVEKLLAAASEGAVDDAAHPDD